MKVPCDSEDGSEVVFDLIDGGRLSVRTTNGHYVSVDNVNLRAITLFLMGHIFPDGQT